MPNTKPNIVDEQSLCLVEKLAAEKAHCDYGIFVGANNVNTNTVKFLANRAIGMKMYLNNTTGSNSLMMSNTSVWLEHLKNWPSDRPVCVHAEAQTLAAILHAAYLCDRHIHVCHVSNREEIVLVRESKKRGMKVTCEVAPHHLFLTANDFTKPHLSTVKPPLSFNQDDVDALWENINFIDCFATDHAPHTLNDKEDECKHCFGFPGLETALPLLLTAVRILVIMTRASHSNRFN
jgi:carbamoyl-phosphate synthase/aspartate carbamoyltransferase/dihydroorotase